MSGGAPDLPPIDAEVVEHLRQGGASKDLIAFAEKHMVRFSQADVDRVRSRWFWAGVLVATVVLTVARLVS